MPLGARPTPGRAGGIWPQPEWLVASQSAPLMTERLAGPSPPLLLAT